MKNEDTIIGAIPKDWDVKEFQDVCEFITDGSHFSPKMVRDGYYMASVKDMTPYGFDFSKCKQISEGNFKELKRNKCSPLKGDILISKDGANCLDIIFEYNQEEDIVLLSSIAIARVNKNHHPGFYTSWLLSPIAQNIMRTWFISGSAIPRVVLKDFKKVPVPIPSSIEEEIKIAEIISLFGKRISLLRRQNAILEEMAQALFRHWFIDFEFQISREYAESIGKSELEGEPYRSSGGEMIEGDREIPSRWETQSLSQIATFLNGLAMQKYPPSENSSSLPVIKIREMKSGISENTDWASAEIPKQYIVKFGDILFSWSGSLELTNWFGQDGALNQHLFKVSSSKFEQWFIYYWTHQHLQNFKAIANSKATTMGHIQRHHLDEAICLIPQKNEVKIMDSIMQPIYEKRLLNAKEINILKSIRDTLLPKLMSGEVRV